MTEQQTPEFVDNSMNSEKGFTEEESEKGTPFDDLLLDVIRDLDKLTPFAIEVLNPFPSIEELEQFSAKHGWGANKIIHFMKVSGGGEDIQGAYIQSFIKKFFPKIEVTTVNESKAKNAIETVMADFHELFKIHEPKIMGPDPLQKIGIVFSMVPTKILHSSPPNPEKVNQLRAMFFQEFERICREVGVTPQNLEAPLLVGEIFEFRPASEKAPLSSITKIDISQLRNLRTSFRILRPIEGFILCGFYNAETDTYTEEARLPITSKMILRGLYTIGDFSVVRHYKNKMEAVVAGTKVITSLDYTNSRQNTNVVLDNLLRSLGYIITIDEASHIGLDQLGKAPQLTEQDVRNLYVDYMRNQDRVDLEPSLKESMQKLFDRIAAPQTGLMNFIRNIYLGSST